MDDQSWKDVFELLNTVDAALFGRVTYKDFENYWLSAGTNPETPKNERDFLPGLRRAVVAGKGSSTGLHAGEEIAFSIGRFSASGAVAHREAAENPTNNCLRTPWRHVIRGDCKAQRTSVHFRAGLGLQVVREGDKGAMKVLSVVKRISNSQIDERS
jgi:hypothetical protein